MSNHLSLCDWLSRESLRDCNSKLCDVCRSSDDELGMERCTACYDVVKHTYCDCHYGATGDGDYSTLYAKEAAVAVASAMLTVKSTRARRWERL